MLIVCEGEKTEPSYFNFLKPYSKLAWEDTRSTSIDIKPKPNLEEEAVQPTKKTKRRKRQLKQSNKIQDTSKIESHYKAQPLRYVREAQQGLEDGVYAEVWAVFDKDVHPKHEEAFELAQQEIEGKTVNIAFSSIAFEHWFLLHFEKNQTPFLKSACRIKQNYFNCGTGEFPEDCYGAKCLAGYLKINQYLPNYIKSGATTNFKLLLQNQQIAFENAAWLRFKMPLNQPIYELNPYTTVDKLVKSL